MDFGSDLNPISTNLTKVKSQIWQNFKKSGPKPFSDQTNVTDDYIPAQQIEGHHPQRGEGEREQGQGPGPQLIGTLGAGAEEYVEHGVQSRQEEVLEEHDRGPEDAAV